MARFKDLVLDAVDGTRLGAFWGHVLGREWHAQDNGDGWLSGPTPQHTIWINQVPEPLTIKNRVHFDVYTSSLARLEDLGATIVQPYERWTIMADPEGTRFCALLRDEVPRDRMPGLVVDCAEPASIAAWRGGVYQAPVEVNPEGWAAIGKVAGMPLLSMAFNLVPEVKTVKNRVHWDVTVTDLHLQALLDAGATLLRPETARSTGMYSLTPKATSSAPSTLSRAAPDESGPRPGSAFACSGRKILEKLIKQVEF